MVIGNNMNEELRKIYSQTFIKFAYGYADTKDKKTECLNTIQLILKDSELSYIEKLQAINMYVHTNRELAEIEGRVAEGSVPIREFR